MQKKNVTLQSLPDLSALRVSNGALRGDNLPARVKILDWGTNPSIKGDFKVGAKTLACLEANQKQLGFERVAIDYNHTSVPGTDEYQPGRPPAIFGYGTVRVKENDGIYLEDVTWTPAGLEHARNYEDLSPTVHQEPGSEVDYIHSVALCTNGCLDNVTFFSATTDKTNMTTNTSPGTGVTLTLALLASGLGLAATATEAEVTTKLQRLSALDGLLKDGKLVILDDLADHNKRLAAIEAASTKGFATLSATIAGKVVTISPEDIVTLSSKVADLEKRLAESKTSLEAKDRDAIIAKFSAEGRVPLAADGKPMTTEALTALSVDHLKILLANTPATVPLHARGRVASDAKNDLKGAERTAAAWAHLD